ncbi:methyl-accepting chemotaxis protein McpS [bacterium BMS3Abin04]|nr:methyl-accepting chemotaxis protein McpS [bacterium BMS3Abin04]
MKLINKFYALSAVFLFVISGMILLTFLTLDSQKSDGIVINLAGRQRMLSQKIAKEAFAVTEGKNDFSDLMETATLFNTTLEGLIRGNSELKIPPTENGAILSQLNKVNSLWTPFFESIKLVGSNNPIEVKKGKDYILESNQKLLSEMNKAVKMFESSSVRSVAKLKTYQLIFLAVLFSVMFFTIKFINKKIVKPIDMISKAAHEVSTGNLDIHVEKNSNGEIGSLANDFNEMVKNIKKTRVELLREKQSVEKRIEEAVAEAEDREKYLSESVERMLEKMQKFASGDLTVICIPSKDDEIGKLYHGFNAVVQNMKNMISHLTESIQATASASAEISATAEVMASGSKEQNNQTIEIADAVQKMTTRILENTNNSLNASQSANEAGEIAKEGGQVVEETIKGMNRIAEVVENASQTVKELGKSSNKIGEIIQVIEEIADQTNLLALNAAIEAARAGEQGRGFAVVADEVRKLAERTTKATKEIGMMIKQIQKDTQGAVNSMEQGTVEVNTGKELAKKSGESLEKIINGFEKVVEVVNEVASVSEEQSENAEHISQSVETISSLSLESSVGAEQIAQATEDLNHLTENLQDLAQQFIIDGRVMDVESSSYHVRENGKIVET